MSWESWINRNVKESYDAEEGAEKSKKTRHENFSSFAKFLEVDNDKRKRELVTIRYLLFEDFYLNVENVSLSYTGKLTQNEKEDFPGHDHATVMRALRNLKNFRSIKDSVLHNEEKRYLIFKEKFEEKNLISL